MSDPIDTGHSLAQPTLPEAILIEDVAVAAVGLVAQFVPGGGALFTLVSDAVDTVEKAAPPIEQIVSTLLGIGTQLVGAENLRKMLDGETITLVNAAADAQEDVKFGPAK